jgi:hypothetical protein
MVAFLVGFMAGAVATAYTLGILLSSSRESRDEEGEWWGDYDFDKWGTAPITYRVTVHEDGSVTDESGDYWT